MDPYIIDQPKGRYVDPYSQKHQESHETPCLSALIKIDRATRKRLPNPQCIHSNQSSPCLHTRPNAYRVGREGISTSPPNYILVMGLQWLRSG
jgi:hypothetical protein